MLNFNKLVKKFMAMTLFVVLAFPVLFNFYHTFEKHEHVVCSESSYHLHKSESVCHTCDFHHISYNFEPFFYNEVFSSFIYERPNIELSKLGLESSVVSNLQLRAPPSFS